MFKLIFFQPVLNLLIFLYNNLSFQNLGVAIILLTIIIKLVFWSLSKKSIKSQKLIQEIQPKIDELKIKYKDNQAEMSKQMMALYKENKVNPFSSCFPLLIQMPFFIAIFRIFREDISKNFDLLYPFINNPGEINYNFFSLNLASPIIVFAVLAGIAQFWQSKSMMSKMKKNNTPKKSDSMSSVMSKQMLYFMPVMTIIIGVKLPGGLTLYLLVLTLMTALQQVLVNRKKINNESNIIKGEIVK